jgi:hypothetical protein
MDELKIMDVAARRMIIINFWDHKYSVERWTKSKAMFSPSLKLVLSG